MAQAIGGLLGGTGGIPKSPQRPGMGSQVLPNMGGACL